MYVHVFPDDKFTATNIQIISQSKYGENSIFFILKGEAKYVESKYEKDNVIFINGLFDRRILSKLMHKNYVIFHSLFITPKDIVCLFLLKNYSFRWNWVIWGGDLHSNYQIVTMKNKIKYLFFKSVVSRFGFVTTLSDKDYLIAREKYCIKGKKLSALYALPGIDNTILKKKSNNDKSTVKILVGNSANKSNQHCQVLKDLEHLNTENIQIIVPLSYSVPDDVYVESVIKLGKKIFQDKFLPITEYMSPKRYYELLSTIDVAIFNSNRQQALGNIYVLMNYEAKIFFNKDSGLIEKFRDLNARIFLYDDIKEISLEELCQFDKLDSALNKEISSGLLDYRKVMNQWESVLKQMKG